MNLEVTQQNLYLFLPGKIANVAGIIAAKEHCSQLEAMQRFYASKTYRALQREETKLWHFGAVALYEMYCEDATEKFSIKKNIKTERPAMTKEDLNFTIYCVGIMAESLDVLHTFSREYIIEDLTRLMKKKGLLAA